MKTYFFHVVNGNILFHNLVTKHSVTLSQTNKYEMFGPQKYNVLYSPFVMLTTAALFFPIFAPVLGSCISTMKFLFCKTKKRMT